MNDRIAQMALEAGLVDYVTEQGQLITDYAPSMKNCATSPALLQRTARRWPSKIGADLKRQSKRTMRKQTNHSSLSILASRQLMLKVETSHKPSAPATSEPITPSNPIAKANWTE